MPAHIEVKGKAVSCLLYSQTDKPCCFLMWQVQPWRLCLRKGFSFHSESVGSVCDLNHCEGVELTSASLCSIA